MALSVCNSETGSQGRELAEHGTVLFPVAIYEDDLSQNPVPWHWHEELEVIWVLEGTVTLSAASSVCRLGPGEGAFLNTGILHSLQAAEDVPCRLRSVVFHPRLVGGSMDSVFWHNYLLPLLESQSSCYVLLNGSAPWHKKAGAAITAAWQTVYREKPGYEFAVRNALSRLIFLLSENRPAAAVPASGKALRDAERIKCMLLYIQAHYKEPLQVSDIAASALISESECLRCFKRTIGTAPLKYVKQFRIQKAAALLLETGLGAGEIGALCGFPDTSYFTKTFRSLKGCTPSRYRSQNRQPSEAP